MSEEKNSLNPDFDPDEIVRDAEKTIARFEKVEEESLKMILKHFDRIHDKLFTFNNILIAGYFALSKLNSAVPATVIVIPIINLAFLIYVDYRLMEINRNQSKITTLPIHQIKKYLKASRNTNLYSLLIIVTTSIVVSIFLYYAI